MTKRLKGQKVDTVKFKDLQATIRFHKNGLSTRYSESACFTADYDGEYIRNTDGRLSHATIEKAQATGIAHLRKLQECKFIPIIQIDLSIEATRISGRQKYIGAEFELRYSRFWVSETDSPARWCPWGVPEEWLLSKSQDTRGCVYGEDGRPLFGPTKLNNPAFSRNPDDGARTITIPYTDETWEYLEQSRKAMYTLFDKVQSFFVENVHDLATGSMEGNMLSAGGNHGTR